MLLLQLGVAAIVLWRILVFWYGGSMHHPRVQHEGTPAACAFRTQGARSPNSGLTASCRSRS